MMLLILVMKKTIGFGFPSKNIYWILSQTEALSENSIFHLPCAFYSLSLDILPIHLGRIKYFYNESDASDRCQIDDSGGGSLKCSRSPHRDGKEKELCVERLIVKLSTGNSLAYRRWFKFRHNLEAFQSQKGVCHHIDAPSSPYLLVELNWNLYSNTVYN